MKVLAVEYQVAINNANIKCKIHSTILSMELLIAEARGMYKMRGLGQDAHADQKKMEAAAATVSTGSNCNFSSMEKPDTSRNTVQRKAKAAITTAIGAEAATVQPMRNVHYVDGRVTR